MSLHLRQLTPPVVIVTRGRGAETYHDAGRLLDRLAELPQTRDEVMQIERGGEVVSPEGIKALSYMLLTVGLDRFFTASKRQQSPARAIGTKYNWAFLGEYLGWEWRARK